MRVTTILHVAQLLVELRVSVDVVLIQAEIVVEHHYVEGVPRMYHPHLLWNLCVLVVEHL